MEDKKTKEELNEQIEREISGVSCDSCPIDSVLGKLFGLFRQKK